jgi:hypothetical protein
VKLRARHLLILVATAWLVACASAQNRTERGSNNVLTVAQLSATNAENLYDAINRLRPSWLTSRGPTSVTNSTPSEVSVFMAGTFLGHTEYLQQTRVLDITEVKYWDPGAASARFGMGHPRGVIELTRK